MTLVQDAPNPVQTQNKRKNADDLIPGEEYGCEISCGPYQSKRRRIPCLQAINNSKGALVFLCFALLMEGIINAGLFNAVISTIEKRFQLRSTESGIIASGFDIFTCIALVVIAIHGDKGRKPLWFGWGTFIMGVGCVVYSIPHFTAPSYSYVADNSTMCNGDALGEECSESGLRNYIYLFVLSNGLIGLGSTPLFTMAVTYLDENVKQTNSALYGGIYYSMGGLGPALGYLLGSGLLSVYTDIGKTVSITSENSAWVGAWWIGFLVIGIACILISFFIMMFPKYLPGTARFRQNRNSERQQNGGSSNATADETFGESWKDMPKILLLLCRNLPFITLTLANCINYAFVYGFNTFGTKYIEQLFGVPTSFASLYYGIASIFAAVGGQFLGGLIVSKLKLKVRGIIKFLIICTVLSILGTFGFLMHCDQQAFSGGAEQASDGSARELLATCASPCQCTAEVFEPVCGQDDVTYFSPCFAGCQGQLNDTHFGECHCINSTTTGGMAAKEICQEEECTGISVGFGLMLFVSFFTTFLTTTPNLQATLRCVPFHLRTQAVSLQVSFSCEICGMFDLNTRHGLQVTGSNCSDLGTYPLDGISVSVASFSINLHQPIDKPFDQLQIFSFLMVGGALLLYKPTTKIEDVDDDNNCTSIKVESITDIPA